MAKAYLNVAVSDELRPCVTIANGNKCKGLFHKWLTESFGNVSAVVGIIELETGVIIKESPEYIRFIDNKVKQYFAENFAENFVDDDKEEPK